MTVTKWVQNGGNVAVVLVGDLVCIDQDSDRLTGALVSSDDFSATFTVRTGSGGAHNYYLSPGWDRGTVDLEDGDGEHVGEIRSGEGTITVVPPSLHELGCWYDVLRDLPIAEVEREDLDALADRFDGADDQDDGDQDDGRDADRRDRGRVGGGGLDELDRLIDHDGKRRELRSILRDPEAGHHERLYLAGFLLDVVGLSVSETVGVIDRHNRWSNYDRDVTREQVESVAKSSGGGSV